MGTLFYASRGGLDDSVRRQAQKTLVQLEQLRGGRDQVTDDVSSEDFITRIRSEVLAASADIGFSVTGTRTAGIPSDVAAAFAEATAEAVRNSLDHAGYSRADVTRTALVSVSESRVRVVVRDDGEGFDFRDVAPHRLGILVSIRGRFATIPGGTATVESHRGVGTVVSLSWSAA
jgi:signal transduction histidine kinase